MKRSVALIGFVIALMVASCSADETGAPPETTSAPTTSSPPPPVTTDAPTTSSEPPISPPSASSTPAAPPTTSSTATPPTCDVTQAGALLDATVALARLRSGGTWDPDGESVAFGERTNEGAEFGARLGFDCAERLVQRTPTGAERLALIAWNDVRHAAVIQATDAPSEPYDTTVRFQLFMEQSDGEWLEDGFVWAATLAGGESIVIDTHDYSTGVTAKSWQSFVPRFEDLPVTLESERFGIDSLVAAGARNVSVAEPASVGYPVGTIQFNTPLALSVFAAVGPTDAYDPMVPIVTDGETSFTDVGGVPVRLTVGVEVISELYETGWICADHAWRLYTILGSPDELLSYTERLIEHLDC